MDAPRPDVADAGPDVAPDVAPDADANPDAPPGPAWCSVGTDAPGAVVPAGFCVRRYATVPEARTLAFAPNGDLFVGSPSQFTPGGASGGMAAIVVLSDDNRDGTAEVRPFARGLVDVHGLAIGGGSLYFTTMDEVYRTPLAPGQRQETVAMRQRMMMPPAWATGGRWTHGLARSAGGQLIGSRGQYSSCGGEGAGEISQLGMGTMTPLATGFRNPMYLRCHYRDEVCFGAELGEDQTPGAREKLVLVRPGRNFGYPCCYTTDLGVGTANCAAVAREEASFPIGETPFGFDWERGVWPMPYRDGIFVALHGSFYTSPPWQGAGIVWVPTDPTTHAPSGAFQPFFQGFGYGGAPLDRPSDVAFAPDGRMFVADDVGGAVYWVAPTSLRMPAR